MPQQTEVSDNCSKEACDLILAKGVFQRTKYSVRHNNTCNPQQLSEVVTEIHISGTADKELLIGCASFE